MSFGRKGPAHCLSFDVEEHFQVSGFASSVRREDWDRSESRVERNTVLILDLLDDHQVKATFFILGWVAERHPHLVRAMSERGHEIASHGYGHEMITTQTPDEFRADIGKSKRILEDITGKPIYGYRAPSFSITPSTKWALQVLVEEGYRYDSSIFPVLHDRYGMPGANPQCHELKTESGAIWEVPPSTLKLGNVRVPIAGGGYFRLYPYPVLRWMLRQVESDGHPLVMYLHPWELDPSQPRMNGPWLSRLRHYLNLSRTEGRLVELLSDFAFGPIQRVVPALQAIQ